MFRAFAPIADDAKGEEEDKNNEEQQDDLPARPVFLGRHKKDI
jgi:hypothetical protein